MSTDDRKVCSGYLTQNQLTKSNPNNVQVCAIIFESHFSFGSGGGVPAIGCGRGLVAVPVLFALECVTFPVRAPVMKMHLLDQHCATLHSNVKHSLT